MAEPALHFQPYLSQRFQALVWSCLDSELTKTAVFYAERYFAMEPQSHEARHLYATALLRQGQPHSALTLVKLPREQQCVGCLELKAKCCTTLGRHRQAKEALEESLRDVNFASSASAPSRPARPFPDEAALRCRSGNMSLKGNLPEDASLSFRQALALNPLIWEAFEGLCAVGARLFCLSALVELNISYHNAAQNAPAGDPKKALLRYGLDLMNGEVRDNVTAGVLEPTMSKVKSLKSAYEAAVSLLRIDDAIQCVPEQKGEPDPHGH